MRSVRKPMPRRPQTAVTQENDKRLHSRFVVPLYVVKSRTLRYLVRLGAIEF
jgi:hypothetical protein